MLHVKTLSTKDDLLTTIRKSWNYFDKKKNCFKFLPVKTKATIKAQEDVSKYIINKLHNIFPILGYSINIFLYIPKEKL